MEHKAATKFFQASLSWASHLISCQVLFAAFTSSSIVLLQVHIGLPLFLFPGGVYFREMLGGLLLLIRRMWPSHLHLLFLISSFMQFIPVFLRTSLFEIWSSQLILSMRRRHLPSNPLRRLLVLALVFSAA